MGLVPGLLSLLVPHRAGQRRLARATEFEGQERAMKLTTRMVAALSLMGFAVAGTPAVASAKSSRQSPPPAAIDGRATLYELTENMKVVQRNKRKQVTVSRRIATSALSGLASPGSPLCPIVDLPSDGEQPPCVVNVQG